MIWQGLGRGVRRIVGVTAAKAKAAFDTAAELLSRVNEVRAQCIAATEAWMPKQLPPVLLAQASKLEGQALTVEANELTKMIESAVIPAVDRKKLTAGVQVGVS